MPLELGEKFSEGAGHIVYINPQNSETLIKVPKRKHFNLSYDQAAKEIEIANRHFAAWIPQTSIHQDGKGYYIEQEHVQNAAHIKPANLEIEQIADEVEEILETNRRAMKDTKVGLDFLGYEGSVKSFLSKLKRFKGTIIDSGIITPGLKMARITKPSGVPGKCLDWWNDPNLSPEITNLIIGTRMGTVRQIAVVDLSLLYFGSDSAVQRARAAFLQNWNEKYLQRDFGLNIN